MAVRDGRLYTWLITLASVLFVLLAGYWNMSGWRFKKLLPGVVSWLIV
jgi:hypothetical protein